MNKIMTMTFPLVILLLFAALPSCGGSSGSVAGIDGSGSPVASTTSTTGTVNGFGSVIVNGVRYDTSKAKILVNGIIASEDNLRAGYQVRVTGSLNSDGSGNASLIEFTPNLVGAITAIDEQLEQILLLEQTVQISNSTVFDPAIEPNDLSGLAVGTRILVSGQLNSEGMIAATRIELAEQQSQQLLGTIGNLNIADASFTLNDLAVNFSAASFNNIPNNQLKNGLAVSVTGTLNNNGIFAANTITLRNPQFANDVKTAEVEGFITRFVSVADFDVAGIPCRTDSTTVYSNGASNNVALGSLVKVAGTIKDGGVLVAQKIEFRAKAINEISGQVSNLTSTITGLIATGNFQIAGTTIQTDNATVYEDKGSQELKRFNFLDIQPGNFLKVTGYTRDSLFIATKIERKKSEQNNELRYDGIISALAIDTHSFVVYEQTLYIDAQTQIRGDMGQPLTETEFFAQAANQQVRVRAVLVNGVLTARMIELRKENGDFFRPPKQRNDHAGDKNH